MERSYASLSITQDLGLGMMLWFTHLAPTEPWAVEHRERSLRTLERLWRGTRGYFARDVREPNLVFAFTNYGVSIGLQAIGVWPERVRRLNASFEMYRTGDHYDTDAITHIMACASPFPGRLIRPPAVAPQEAS